MTIEAFCAEVNNYFDHDRQFGLFTVEDGTLTVKGAQEGQYIRIVGSVFNDGVYQYPVTGLTDETFDGAVWLLAIPGDVISFVDEVTAWETANADAINSPFQSESFGGYSYSKGSASNGGDSAAWQNHFASRLNRWRKICPY